MRINDTSKSRSCSVDLTDRSGVAAAAVTCRRGRYVVRRLAGGGDSIVTSGAHTGRGRVYIGRPQESRAALVAGIASQRGE